MVINRKDFIRAVLLDIRERKAGEMEKDGKTIAWDKAVQLILLQWEDVRGMIQKREIDSRYIDTISQQLESVHWGCVVDVTLSNNKVVSLSIVEDVMASLYVNEPLNLDL